MPIPLEPNPGDVRFDKWLGRFKIGLAFAIGIATGFSGLMYLGDSRYARRDEVTALHELQKHDAADRARFATKEELGLHSGQAGHPTTVDVNRRQEARIHRLEANQGWIASALYAMARRSGIQLPPPPELRDPGPEPDEP